ncbi:transketolase [bacterium]|jgi:transketolase|nr:transketolase [bacterium]
MKDQAKLHFLRCKAYNLRRLSVISTSHAGSGHPTTCLSAADIVAALFFDAMQFDAVDISDPNNDRFILSKGHAAPLLYAAWQQVGVVSEDDLLKLRSLGSPLEGHPTKRFAYTEAATGSLGCGLSVGAGMALAGRVDGLDYRTYVLLGDGEISEGAIWEAAQFASHYKLSNLIGIVDCNRLGQSGQTQAGHNIDVHKNRFEAFGWRVFVVDGHDMLQLINVLRDAKMERQKPVMILAKTVKGFGIDLSENKNGFHGKTFKKDNLPEVLNELKSRFAKDFSHCEPKACQPKKVVFSERKDKQYKKISLKDSSYSIDDSVATRKAFGHALVGLGGAENGVVVLDGDVKSSTFTELFEKDFPKRFFQCFIAEQNMVGVGVGLASRGKISFISTFSAFFSRAFDQIRMTPLGGQALRLVGSHAGVSIGMDGPSQMGLEDLALMRSLPDSVVLYPSDGVSAHRLVEEMANYHDGISYMRTTRMATPIVYSNNEKFNIGGCKVLRYSKSDVACVIGAGVTLCEALKAYDKLQKDGISVSVIDLYSIKPFDEKTVLSVAKASCLNVVTVEDHYVAGGIGEMISSALCNYGVDVFKLAINELPRSGRPEELLAHYGIDANSIVKTVKKLVAK